MAVSFVGNAQGVSTSVTPPAHTTGDLFMAFAVNMGSTTIPTLPSGWTDLATSGTDPAIRVCYKVAASSSETASGFTNANLLNLIVYRGAGTPGTPSLNSGTSTSIDYNSLTLTNSSGSSWVLAHGSANDTIANMTTDGRDTTPGTATSGRGGSGTTGRGAWAADTGTGVTSWSAVNDALSVSHKWRTAVVEIPASGGATYTLDAAAGSYAVTGGAATLPVDRALNAAAGSYSVTGASATLPVGWTFTADAGSYAVTGAAASLPVSWALNAAAGSYAVTGASAELPKVLNLIAEAGAYTLTGTSANIGREFFLTADAGSYAVSGAEAYMPVGWTLNAVAGSYAIAGADVELVSVASTGTNATWIVLARRSMKR